MFSSLKIARLLGITVQIHWSFWLLPLWAILTWNEAILMPLWMYLLVIGALFVCVVMHEYGHAIAAKRFGIRTRSITLTPLGGIAHLERMTHKPWEEFCIAVAGPLVNVGIAIVLGMALMGGFGLGWDLESSMLMHFLGVLLVLNIVMVVFNMIPAFPMDGGRVLRSILAGSLGLLEGTRVAVAIGTATAIAMGMAGAFLLGNPWLVLIALFVMWVGFQELRALEMEQELQAEEDAMPVAYLPKPKMMHITICQWDPQRQQWVRRTYVEPTSGVR
jgi:Zn-dependent protease